MPKQRPVTVVKARFADCVREVERGASLLITRHGKPVAALVPASDVERLARLRAAGPAAGLASVAGGWKGSEEFVAILERRRRTPRRRATGIG